MTDNAAPIPIAAPYGWCPVCERPGATRERRINGNDQCQGGHIYPSRDSLRTPSLRVVGASRLADNDRAILLSFNRAPSDDELRALHDRIR